MIFDLVKDFADVLESMPREHPRQRILKLLDEAIRRDVHFIDRHPTTLFQCLWNTCWWYDCSEAASRYRRNDDATSEPLPWEFDGFRLASLLERWRHDLEGKRAGSVWIRSLRPPFPHLGTGLRAVYTGHTLEVMGVAIAPDRRLIATNSFDKTVRLWDIESGKAQQCLEAESCAGKALTFSRDGQLLAFARSGMKDRSVRIWNVDAQKECCKLFGQKRSVEGLVFTPDGRRLVGVSTDGSIAVWDIASAEIVYTLVGTDEFMRTAAFSTDATQIVTGTGAGVVRVRDVATGVERHCFQHAEGVRCVAISADGRLFAGAFLDNILRIWDTGSGELLFDLKGSHLDSLAFSPVSPILASGGDDRTIRIWDVNLGKELRCLRGHQGPITDLKFSADGRFLISGSHDGSARLWDPIHGENLRTLRGHDSRPAHVAFSPDGRLLLTAARNLFVWDANTGEQLVHYEKTEFNEDLIWAVSDMAFSPDGRELAIGYRNDIIWLWDMATGMVLDDFKGLEGAVKCLTYSHDGRYLASGSSKGTIHVWEVATRSKLVDLVGHTAEVESVSFTLDDQRLVSQSRDKTRRMWDWTTGDCVEVLQVEEITAESNATFRGLRWRDDRIETTLIADSNVPAGWYADTLYGDFTPHPFELIWAGKSRGQLCHIKLERFGDDSGAAVESLENDR